MRSTILITVALLLIALAMEAAGRFIKHQKSAQAPLNEAEDDETIASPLLVSIVFWGALTIFFVMSIAVRKLLWV